MKHKGYEIESKEVLLRYFYSSDMKMENCIKNLEGYYKWFNDPEIQNLSQEGRTILKMGYIYHYDFSLEGKPFVVMQLGDVNLDKYQLKSYFQAMNYVNKEIIEKKMVKGHI